MSSAAPMRIGQSGLQASAAEISVIGNNIANSNTAGFKGSRTEFGNVIASSLGSSSRAIGSGVRINAVDQQFAPGNIIYTNNSLDMAISGNGFFQLLDHSGSTVYSRAGAFMLDSAGYIVNSQGERLIGRTSTTHGDVLDALGPMRTSQAYLDPKATSNVSIGANLDAGAISHTAPFDKNDLATWNNITTITIYDSLGMTHAMSFYFRKDDEGEWTTHLLIDDSDEAATGSPISLSFDENGHLESPAENSTIDISEPSLSLTLNFLQMTQYDGEFGVNELAQDGYSTGHMAGVIVDENGIIFGRYTNGETKTIGQVVLTDFLNPRGLIQLGNNTWAGGPASGAPTTGDPGTAGLGMIQGGSIEASNVDLTGELVSLITAQRNFQANAQVISTADTLMQTLLNIR
ncbi:MAG: flagellar hook protein FlgE [Thermodesulfobacteriota bacterium]|nr:flagellar hook protein FlgE [Thermodesulfobacteriota bacterium]